MSAPRRALLVEFVNADQTPGRISSLFPLLKGSLLGAGVAARWVRFAVPTTNLLVHGRDEITLSDDDLAVLLALAAEQRPDVLFATDALADLQRAAVERLVSGACHWRVQVQVPKVEGLPQVEGATLLDLPGFTPDYAWEAGNAAALRREIDNVYLLTTESCGHRRSVAENPCYRGVSDARVGGRLGCAFCSNWIGASGAGRSTPLAWVLKQVRAVAASRGASERYPNALLLTRLEDPELLVPCLDALNETGLAAHTQLLVAVRTDRAVAFDRFVRAEFAAHPDSPLRIGVYASGIESFAADDLARFNKETSPLDGLRAVTLFRKLKADFPARFSYEGLSFILFSPWTTLETLHQNVGLLHFLRFHEIGNLFEARLRLHPDLAITALAERDGVIEVDESDPVLVSNRRKLFEREVAWRFLEPRLRPLSRVALRLDLRSEELDDPLLLTIERRLAAVRFPPRKDARLALLLALVDVARAAPEVLDEEVLLDRALQTWAEREAPAVLPPDGVRAGLLRLPLAEFLRRAAPLLQVGPRQVLSLEGVGRAQVDAGVLGVLNGGGLAWALVDPSTGRSVDRGTLVVAREASALAETLAQGALAARGGPERGAAVRGLGSLHGVPECCASAWAADPESQALGLPWAAVSRRSEVAGPVPAACNPLLVPALAFVPCRADCPEAGTVLGRVAAAFCPELLSGDGARAFVVPLAGDSDADLVALCLRRVDDEGFDYDVDDPAPGALAEVLRAGDRLTVGDGQLRVSKGGRVLDVMTATHAVWSPLRAWAGATWRELARGKAFLVARDAPVGGPASKTAPPPAARSRVSIVTELLRRLLERYPERFGGVALLGVDEGAGDDELRVRVALEGLEVGLTLRAAAGGEPGFVRTEHFDVAHLRETPVTSPAQRALVRALCVGLDRALSRWAPRCLPRLPSAD